jgi:hypothetical protein
MANESYHKAYEAAATELEQLLQQQTKVEERILALRKSMNALALLISEHEGADKNFWDYANAEMRKMVDTSLTTDIKKIMATSGQALTTSDVRDELNKLGGSLAEQSNPLATINAILNRLKEQGYVTETLKDGRKAWRKVSWRVFPRRSLTPLDAGTGKKK